MIQYHLYPGYKKRIVTFSYDDGHPNDERLIALFDSYGVRATFHLNGQKYIGASDEKLRALRERYKNHEIACHTFSHGWPARMPMQSVIRETIEDRMILEKIAGYPVTGMSYPSGSFDENVARAMSDCGIRYSRTTRDTNKFLLPEDPLMWHPTCHHRFALELCDKFLENLDSEWTNPLFYIWGHSHELRTEEDWAHIEAILKKLAGNDKIWYAANGEIIDYMNAQKQVLISADETIFTNPTAITVLLERDKTEYISVPAGTTVTIPKK